MTGELEAAAREIEKCVWTPIRNAHGHYINECVEIPYKLEPDFLYCPNCGRLIEVK